MLSELVFEPLLRGLASNTGYKSGKFEAGTLMNRAGDQAPKDGSSQVT